MMRFISFILFFSYLHSGQDYIDYPHPFHPTSSKSGMVVSQNILSSDIGIEILDMGGNAVDAAVAVGFSLPPHYLGQVTWAVVVLCLFT